jgi:hypothetical protein
MPHPLPNGVPARISRSRDLAAAACGLFGLAFVALAFWRLDLRYALPTPVPASHAEVAAGVEVQLPPELVPAGSGPLLLHFFNPQCPCSRFNLEHVHELARRFAGKVRVVAVLEADESEVQGTRERWLEDFDTVLIDDDGSIAAAVGVYSTPQAALVDARGQLFWRGNYNLSRYCVTPETEFARIALERLCAGEAAPPADSRALVAWGCPLPTSEVQE